MPIEAYPSSLPQPVFNGYSTSMDAGLLRSQMEGGNTRVRKQYSTTTERVNCTWQFSTDNYSLFKLWYEQVAMFGLRWVSVPLDIGFGVQSYEARIENDLSPKLTRYGWDVSATLELRNISHNHNYQDLNEFLGANASRLTNYLQG